ncbi:MAG: insulinase family protein [Desulfovibrionaceae bacterium]|nr:insulinase family protein [Desulfovibrionaceae bacterium]
MSDEILTRLPNGLTVYIVKDTRFPLVLTRLYVHTGSANERAEQAGISHLLEHMVFKGTKLRPKGKVAQDVEAKGGYLNAATSFDRTYYLTDMPKEHWRMGIDVVYDMAFEATLDPNELKSEKDVVVSELKGNKDDPEHRLFEEVQTATLENTVYGRPIIGYEPVVRAISSADLKAYRDYWYQPQNMDLLIAGDLDTQEVFAYVQELFSKLKNTHTLPIVKPLDLQHTTNSKRIDVQYGPWKKAYFGLAFPAPSLTDLRSVDLDVLCYLLAGDATSKFYRTYKYERQLVDDISCGNMSLARGGLLYLTAELSVDKLAPFWEGLSQDLAKLKIADFNQASISRAALNLEDDFVKMEETLNGLVRKKSTIQFMLGGETNAKNLLERIRTIQPSQLAQAITHWLDPGKMRLRVLAPVGSQVPDLEKILQQNWPAAAKAQEKDPGFMQGSREEISLEHGCKVILLPDTNVPYFSLNMNATGGNALLTKGQQGLSHLTAALLTTGAGEYDAQGLNRYLAERAASLAFSANRQTFSMSLAGPSKYTADLLQLAKVVLQQPRFAPQELQREQQNMLAALQSRQDQPLAELFSKVKTLVYKDHVYGFDDLGTPDLIKGFTIKDVQAYWQKQQAEPWVLAICGSFKKEQVLEFAHELTKHTFAPKVSVATPVLAAPDEFILKAPGRTQTHLVKLFPTVPYDHEDMPALLLLSHVLSGQSGLLFSSMRDEEGLGYTVHAFTRGLQKAGWFVFYIGTEPSKLKDAEAGFARIINEVKSKPLDPSLLKTAYNRLLGGYLRKNQSLANRSVEAAQDSILGYPPKFYLQLCERCANITPLQLQAVAQKYLQVSKGYTAILEP